MSDIILDGDFTVATVMGPPRFSPAFERDTTLYVLEQDYLQLESSFAPLALNTAASGYADFLLVSESQHEAQIGGVVKWTRTYAKRPPTRNEYSSLSYNFIGLYGTFGVNIVAITGRDRFTKTVNMREQWDFFLIPADYATPELIPTIPALKYTYGASATILADYLADSPPFTAASTPSRTTYENLVATGQEIAARDSILVPWKGNFWIRKSSYIVAQ